MKNLLRLRVAVLVTLTHHVALPLLKLVRRPIPFPYALSDLQRMPAGTLGHDLYLFLSQRQLQLLPYYARHDLKHLLLGYDTTEEGEACLQCFMLGNGRRSFPVLATVVFAFATMPEYWQAMRKAYRRGRKARPIQHWQWQTLMQHDTSQLRRQIFSSPTTLS